MAGYEAYPLIELENDLEAAREAVCAAVDGIEGMCGEDDPAEAERCLEAMCLHYPGLRELLDRLRVMATDLRDPFTPEMKERLKKEREQYDDEADRWEAQLYQ